MEDIAPYNSENTYTAFVSNHDCAGVAGAVSCDAMTGLAQKEALFNRTLVDYQTVYPACERFQQLADRAEEYKLQKPPGFMRNMCFEKMPSFQQGPWQTQLAPVPPQNVRFDTWTRAKGATRQSPYLKRGCIDSPLSVQGP